MYWLGAVFESPQLLTATSRRHWARSGAASRGPWAKAMECAGLGDSRSTPLPAGWKGFP
jgi:hypothetical protein